MNTTTASHAFFLLFVMAIAVVIDSTSATEHADVRRRTKAAKGSNPTKVCLGEEACLYNIQGSKTTKVGSYEDNELCGYPDNIGTEDDYNKCLTEAGFRAGPLVFNRSQMYVGSNVEFQFVSNGKYSPDGFNDSAFKGITKTSPTFRKEAIIEYQADEFYDSKVASITSIEYDVFCEDPYICGTDLYIYTRAPDSTTDEPGEYDCRLLFRTAGLVNTIDWHTISIDLDTAPTDIFEGSVGGCPTDTTLRVLAEAGYVYGRLGTETVGNQMVVFEWVLRGSNIVGYFDNIRIQVEDEDCVRIYDL